MIRIIDAHTHVNMMDPAQRNVVMQRAHDAGIGVINVGADEQSSRDAVNLTQVYQKNTWAVVGYHPHEAVKSLDMELLEALAFDSHVVGIGECGLDYFKIHVESETETKHKQKELFEKQIYLSHKIKKPLVIHCREAFADTIELLKKHQNLLFPEAGILHFFTGTIQDAQALLQLGFSFTFGGLITFNRSFDEIIKYIPNNHLLVETDAPWVAPKSHRGQTNEPLYIEEVVESLALIKGVSRDEMQNILLENTKRVFGLDIKR
ncbi:MAG: TatD family hydrolase [Candidatus Paceibacterota bacterium]